MRAVDKQETLVRQVGVSALFGRQYTNPGIFEKLGMYSVSLSFLLRDIFVIRGNINKKIPDIEVQMMRKE